MRLKTWLWRRGLWKYAPSASVTWHRGSILKPGKRIDYTVDFGK